MSTLMAPELMSFRMVILVLPFTSLTAAKKQPVQKQEYTTATTKHRVRGIEESHLSCGLKTRRAS